MNGKINIMIQDYNNSKDGSLLVKQDGSWKPTTFDILAASIVSRIVELEKLPSKIDTLAKNVNHYALYSKKNFLLVYVLYKINVLSGTIENDSLVDELFNKVINDETSVKDALEKNEYMKNIYEKTFINVNDKLMEI